jgi:hypothetical protein
MDFSEGGGNAGETETVANNVAESARDGPAAAEGDSDSDIDDVERRIARLLRLDMEPGDDKHEHEHIQEFHNVMLDNVEYEPEEDPYVTPNISKQQQHHARNLPCCVIATAIAQQAKRHMSMPGASAWSASRIGHTSTQRVANILAICG